MTDFNTTINIDSEGIDDFVKGLKQADAEIKKIQDELRKAGIPEKELAAQAKRFRDEMIKAARDVEKARINSEKNVEKEVDKNRGRVRGFIKDVGKESLGVFIGGGLGEIVGNLANGFSEIIEKSKGSNKEIAELSESFELLGARLNVVGEQLLTEFSGPIQDGLEIVTDLFFDIIAGVQVIYEELRTLAADLTDNFSEDSILYRGFTFISEQLSNIPALIAGSVAGFIELGRTIGRIFREAGLRIQRFVVNTRLQFNRLTGDDGEVAQLSKRLKEIDLGIKENEVSLGSVGKAFEDAYNRAINRSDELRKANDEAAEAAIRRAKAEEAAQKRLDKLKSDAALSERTAAEVQGDIDKAVAENRLKDAQQFLDELKLVEDQYNNITAALKQSEETQVELNRQLLTTKDELTDISDVAGQIEGIFEAGVADGILSEFLGIDLFRQLPDELQKRFEDLIRPGGDLFTAFIAEGLNNAQADAVVARVVDVSKSLQENLDALAAEGITSPILSEFARLQGEVESLNKQIVDNQKLIDKQGLEAANTSNALASQIEAAQEQINQRQQELTAEANKATVQLFRDNLELARALGESDLFDAIIKQQDIFAQNNAELIEQIESDLETLNNVAGTTVANVSTAVGDTSVEILDQNAAQANKALVDRLQERVTLLQNTRKQQNVELENLEKDFAENEIAAFRDRFSREEKERRLNLLKLTLDIRDAREERDADIKRFNDRALAQERELNDAEIKIIEDHRETLLKLEEERFREEEFIRAGAYLEELQNLEQKNIDVEVETKRFQLEQRQTEASHQKELVEIVEKGGVAIKEGSEEGRTGEGLQEIFETTVSSFQAVFDAYVAYQDAVGQATINAITEQIATIDQRIAETTANINALENDLEGKREGRREALLRGLEIEREQEEALTKKKIEQERLLEEAEREANERRKEAAIAQALINAAVAITGTWAGYASLGPAGPVLAGIQTAAIAATTAFEIATIEAQQFEFGGVLNGPSHNQGGIPFTVNGVPGFEAEGGEAIINKRSTQMFRPLLSAINEAGGGKKFQNGAVLGADLNTVSQALNGVTRSDIMQIAERPIYANITEISNLQARQVQVTDRSSI